MAEVGCYDPEFPLSDTNKHLKEAFCLLQALDAEVVVLFEGVTETGALFSGKRSYLPTEIHWGYVFSEITHQSNSAGRFHAVDLSK